ncbi:alanine--glyoxylate aminotransferase 2 homolog 3, mitochondrial [Nicotiana tabacum]|uniref:alanine--glyoxylate transaminase n=4 Tax=Nicotiana TaxID=4085 RepID=A0A1S4DBE2_TOBAC|nr:PREDICTED: alanine--glyoxylate aminotransferase 2 homolog 3, mitochondrial-like isoform X1 [Nicotiana sylvestris]XP_016510752.1 PREDICTED: alanine--glyoxylate aminotransferase 2 homolog 3, mitochondrial-like isoform X1 [Nicotiana tabacum]
MRRFIPKMALLRKNQPQSLFSCRPNSSVAQSCTSLHQQEDDTSLPKMPPFDYTPPPYTGPSAHEILLKRQTYLNPAIFHFYKKPLNLVDGKMQYLYDENGRRYLDAFGGIATVCCGHCHPEVVESIVNQTKRLQHSTVLYLNHAVADFAEALASKLPGDLKVVFFTNSGTEANELALMMARLYTGCQDVISLRNGYHGNAAGTMGSTAQSSYKFNVVQTGVHHALNPDQYRGVFGSDGLKYARDLDDLITYGTSGRVAGFIAEAIQGVGGILELAPGYLPAVYDRVRKAGGICIADEVQSGFARTGSHFWGFEGHGVVPDIVTMAKGIGNGIPLGAVVTTPEIAKVLTNRSYFNTFGGNPVCTAGGLAVLRVIEKEKLQQNAFSVGSYLKNRLTSLMEKHEIIGDVRGRGLMLGVELVTDRQSKTPAKVEILRVMEQMKEMGVLIGKGGFYGNVFRVTPPLCFTKEDADFLVDVMDYSMSKM